jgi:predicted porin
MKKHLLAAAIATAIAAPAMAQNVSVYGTLDASYVHLDKASGNTTKQDTTDPLGSSVLGFKGSEDLGGGMKASFDLQADLNVDSGTGYEGSVKNAGLSFNRQSWVGISSSMGELRIGRQSDAVENNYGFAAFGHNLFLPSQGREAGGKLAGTTQYLSPTINGFKGTISNTISNTSDSAQANNQYSYSIAYAAGPVTAAYAYANETKTSGSDDQASIINVGYKLGAYEFRASRQKNKVGGSSFNTLSAQTTLSGLIVTGTYGKAKGSAAVSAAYTQTASTGAIVETAATTEADSKQFGLSVAKPLSKRTTVYGAMLSRDYTAAATADPTTYAIGVQHSF